MGDACGMFSRGKRWKVEGDGFFALGGDQSESPPRAEKPFRSVCYVFNRNNFSALCITSPFNFISEEKSILFVAPVFIFAKKRSTAFVGVGDRKARKVDDIGRKSAI